MPILLAVDGGASFTRAGLYSEDRRLLAEAVGKPSNPAEVGTAACVDEIVRLGQSLIEDRWRPDSLAAGIAGASTAAVLEEVARGLCHGLPVSLAHVTDDRWPLLAGIEEGIVVIAGTGASLLGRNARGETVALGGRGPRLGDEGSAFHLAIRSLRACLDARDGLEPKTVLAKKLGGIDVAAIPAWTSSASKAEVAALACAVLACADEGDAVALDCVHLEAAALGRMVGLMRQRLSLPKGALILMAGGLLLGSPLYQEAFLKTLEDPRAARPAPHTGHRAVLEWALQPRLAGLKATCQGGDREKGVPIDQASALEIVRIMQREDAKIPSVVACAEAAIARAVEWAASALGQGGRVIYAGAGTSGRLAVLDAAECVPTFGLPPEKVQALLAGGDQAMTRSVEGAEDDAERGAQMLDPPLEEKDLVIGVAASGTTPFVIGLLDHARRRGVKTVLITCNPACESRADLTVALDTGPEVLAGSTRLKAGTATKMVLNRISTGAMCLTGKVYEGLMVHMRPGNAKLRKRAVSMVSALTRVDPSKAEELLAETGWEIPTAVVMLCRGLDAREARRLLEASGGSLRAVLDGA